MQELPSGEFTLSVCICTKNRPNDLANALNSIYRYNEYILEVIVSDDSTNDDTNQLVTTAYPTVRYVKGPQKGLGANRNQALRQTSGTHVIFIDDDVILEHEFIISVHSYYDTLKPPARSRVILTGAERNQGYLVFPREQNFLGFQRREYAADNEIVRTIVINSTIFPRTLFDYIQFDEQLVYGYDEVDISTRASYAGFNIVLCPSAVNSHYPSAVNRDDYRPYMHASRLYVTFKRYMFSERKPIKAVAYLCIAPSHLFISSILRHGFRELLAVMGTLKITTRYLRQLQSLRAGNYE